MRRFAAGKRACSLAGRFWRWWGERDIMDGASTGLARGRILSRRRLLAGAMAAALATRWRPASTQGAPAVTVSRGPTDRPLVALTFDAGADRGYCASILDTLATSGVRASFGITGQWAEANGDLVRRVVNEGHQLFNHTWSHRSFTGRTPGTAPLSSAQRLQELEATEQMFITLTGVGGRPIFRPPFGDFDTSVLADLGRARFTHNLMWTLDVNGWRGISRDQIVARVASNHGNGFIYLLHVGAQSQEGPALPRIIDALRSRGYGFATVSELLAETANPPPPPPPVFTVGDAFRVTSPRNLRTAPNLDGQVVTVLPVGTVGTVLAGPSPADGYAWYQVETPNGTGWVTSEGLARATLVEQLVAVLIRILRGIVSE